VSKKGRRGSSDYKSLEGQRVKSRRAVERGTKERPGATKTAEAPLIRRGEKEKGIKKKEKEPPMQVPHTES